VHGGDSTKTIVDTVSSSPFSHYAKAVSTTKEETKERAGEGRHDIISQAGGAKK
jgi:hypothetical protein